MNTLSEMLRPRATWRNLILLGAGCLLVNITLIVIGRTFAGSQRLLDLHLLYTPAEAHQFLTQIGAVGRARYLWLLLLSLDLIYPPLYALWLSLAMVMAAGGRSRWLWLPLAAAACDWCENLGIAALIFSYQAGQASNIAWFTMGCTLLKWTFAAASGLAIFGGGLFRRESPKKCA